MLKLSAQHFAQVMESLRANAEAAGSEQRHATRMGVQTKVRLGTLVNGKLTHCYTGLTRDVSCGGVGLFQSTALEPKNQFLICFPEGKDVLVVRCVARFCRAMAEGMYGIGAEFEAIAEPSLAKELVDDAQLATNKIRNSILE